MPEEASVLVAASGTGGHLFPAIVVAKRLRDSGCRVEFVGSGRPLEAKLLDPEGFKRHEFAAAPVMNQGLLGLFKFAAVLPFGLIQALALIRRLRPSLIIGAGGYASFVPVVAAWLCGIPVLLHEAEKELGLANKMLLRFCTKITLAQRSALPEEHPKAVYTGQPVRADLLEVPALLPDSSPSRLLILGGSQGATSLDKTLPELAPVMKELGLEVRHQCRPENAERVKEAYSEAGMEGVQVMDFISNMAEAYSWSDCIIARAGAGAVTEISVVERPALFVPYPAAADNHQVANAAVLVEPGKALLVEEGEGFPQRLAQGLRELCVRWRDLLEAPYESKARSAAQAIEAVCRELIDAQTISSKRRAEI